MKTPMQELIKQVEQWMLDDKEVLKNPSAWSNDLLLEANQMIEVKSEFIEMCKEMLEKEKEQRMEAWCSGYDSYDEDISGDSPLEYYYLTFENKNE
jgi:hypothetical protein